MPANEWYKTWFNSPYYHKLYFEHDDTEAKTFIKRIVDHLNLQKGSKVLDVACGRGRHSKILASFGFDVTGYDLSAENIQYASQFSSDHLTFYQQDMRLPFWVNYFDLALNLFTSFGYFSTRREHDATIRSVSGSLKPSGYFVVDYLNVHYAEDHLVHNELKTIGETAYEIHRWHDEHHFHKKIIVSDPALSQPLTFTEQVAKFSLGDFTDMLSFQNMQVTEVFGSYTQEPYHIRNTPRMIIVARKK